MTAPTSPWSAADPVDLPEPDHPGEGDTDRLVQILAADEYRRLKARRLAEAHLAAEADTDSGRYDLDTLAGVLARPAPPPHRIAGLIPWDASTLIVAQRKTGKTTLVLGLARSLLTGESALGGLAVRPVTGRVAILNYEVSDYQLARWAGQVGVPPNRLTLVNMRGRRNPLAHPADRRRLAADLRAHDVETVIVDPFGRAYSGDQDRAGQVTAWLTDLDRFVRAEVGARDLILTAHAGWDGDRTRGSSALEDWPDVVVTLTRGRDGDDGRYLRAFGRDVDVEEDRLDYDPTTRRLALSGAGGRAQTTRAARGEALLTHVVRIVGLMPGANVSEIERRLKADGIASQKGDVSQAVSAAETSGVLVTGSGPRGARRVYLPTYPDVPRPTPGVRQMPTYPDLPRPTPGVRDRPTPTPPIGGWGRSTGVGGVGESSGVGRQPTAETTDNVVDEPSATTATATRASLTMTHPDDHDKVGAAAKPRFRIS